MVPRSYHSGRDSTLQVPFQASAVKQPQALRKSPRGLALLGRRLGPWRTAFPSV